jgi:hypothetical protein
MATWGTRQAGQYVDCLTAAERTNQGHSFDDGVSFQQAKHLIEQTVTQLAKKRRPDVICRSSTRPIIALTTPMACNRS